MHIPCGCESRKEIMFDRGNLGIAEAAIFTTALVALGAAIIYSKGKTN
jgi:hypothetical protein